MSILSNQTVDISQNVNVTLKEHPDFMKDPRGILQRHSNHISVKHSFLEKKASTSGLTNSRGKEEKLTTICSIVTYKTWSRVFWGLHYRKISTYTPCPTKVVIQGSWCVVEIYNFLGANIFARLGWGQVLVAWYWSPVKWVNSWKKWHWTFIKFSWFIKPWKLKKMESIYFSKKARWWIRCRNCSTVEIRCWMIHIHCIFPKHNIIILSTKERSDTYPFFASSIDIYNQRKLCTNLRCAACWFHVSWFYIYIARWWTP